MLSHQSRGVWILAKPAGQVGNDGLAANGRYYLPGFSLPIQYSSTIKAAYGSIDNTSALTPAKNGFTASAHLVNLVSKSVSTPAVMAMMMPASAPPAM